MFKPIGTGGSGSPNFIFSTQPAMSLPGSGPAGSLLTVGQSHFAKPPAVPASPELVHSQFVRFSANAPTGFSPDRPEIITAGEMVYMRSHRPGAVSLNSESLPVGVNVPLYNGDVVGTDDGEYSFEHPSGTNEPQYNFPPTGIESPGGCSLLLDVGAMADGEEAELNQENLPFAEIPDSYLKFIMMNGNLHVMLLDESEIPEAPPSIFGRPDLFSEEGRAELIDLTVQQLFYTAPDVVRTKVNGEALTPYRWHQLQAGDQIYIKDYMPLTYVGQTEADEVLDGSPGWVMRVVADAVHNSRSIDELMRKLTMLENTDGAPVDEAFRGVIDGSIALYKGLPSRFARAVDDLLAGEGWGTGFPANVYDFRVDGEERFSFGQWSYLRWKGVTELKPAIEIAADISELALAVGNSRLASIGGEDVGRIRDNLTALAENGGSGLQKVPRQLGLRQRAADFLELIYYTRTRPGMEIPPEDWDMESVFELGKKKEELLEYIRSIPRVHEGLRIYHPAQLEELLYQVLERGRPLTLLPRPVRGRVIEYMQYLVKSVREEYPAALNAVKEHGLIAQYLNEDYVKSSNPYSGEHVIFGHQPDALYRYARMFLNSRAKRPIFGVPSEAEENKLIDIVGRFFGEDVSDYVGVQRVIRTHVDGTTDALRKMLKDALPSEKAVLLDVYFGNYHHRRFEDSAHALRIALTLGEAGVYREIELYHTFEGDVFVPYLSIGNLQGVSRETENDYSFIHFHPELYLTSDGKYMGRTLSIVEPEEAWELWLDTPVLADDDGFLDDRVDPVAFSSLDLKNLIEKAKKYRGMLYGRAPRNIKTFSYDPVSDTFAVWAGHRFGYSRIDIHFDERGRSERIRITYGFKTDDEAGMELDRSVDFEKYYKRQARSLGIEIELDEVSYQEISATLLELSNG